MIKRILLLQFILLFSVLSKASEDNWTLYPSYNDVTYCEIGNDKVYVLASGALYSFNKNDNELMLYDKLEYLSDIDIKHIAYSKYINALVIIYNNSNIDILYDDESVYNITDFKNSSVNSKNINSISIEKDIAYLSTEFGVVVLDLKRLEIKNTYTTDKNTLCTSLFKDKLYTGTTEGILRCDTTKNMLDKNNWEKISTSSTEALCEFNDKLYALTKSIGIYTIDGDTLVRKKNSEYYTIYNTDNEIVAPAKDNVTIIEKNGAITTYSTKSSKHILKDGNIFWNCKGYEGFYKSKIDKKSINDITEITTPNSPIRNYCEFMKFTSDEKLLVAGGNINYFDITFYDGTIMEYNLNNQRWFNFPEDTIKNVTKLNYKNVCSVDEDPNESGHFFASSFGYGLYEFKDGKFVKHYNHSNSILESAITSNNKAKYVRVPYIEFDKEGNLWCINTSNIKDIVKVLKKDGKWISLNYKDIENKATMAKLLFDSRGWLWITSLQNGAGLFCAKTKNTPFDTSDDETETWFNQFTNQDGISYNIYQVYSLCEDKNGKLWTGTNAGLFLIDNPEVFFNDGIFKQVKVPRNDGTGLADYLMSGIHIKAIETDAANRKWIGTIDNGIFLISEDGLEIIHHFTTDNSPLPSNQIESIAVNDNTGEVFIGTNKGIASYRSDATRAEEILEDKKIHVYPNPVTSNYNGNISIVGLTKDCNIKIVDGSGYLINEGISKGGMYTWNGRNTKGEKVASGVYHVLFYDYNGKDGEITKILITR